MERAWIPCCKLGDFRSRCARDLCVGLFDLLKPERQDGGRFGCLFRYGLIFFVYYGEAVIRARIFGRAGLIYDNFCSNDHHFLFPYLILSAFLLFSRKVKMFFDPSFIPQIDESSTIFHEPPPPPRLMNDRSGKGARVPAERLKASLLHLISPSLKASSVERRCVFLGGWFRGVRVRWFGMGLPNGFRSVGRLDPRSLRRTA